jgi:hypothetical protein
MADMEKSNLLLSLQVAHREHDSGKHEVILPNLQHDD